MKSGFVASLEENTAHLQLKTRSGSSNEVDFDLEVCEDRVHTSEVDVFHRGIDCCAATDLRSITMLANEHLPFHFLRVDEVTNPSWIIFARKINTFVHGRNVKKSPEFVNKW